MIKQTKRDQIRTCILHMKHSHSQPDNSVSLLLEIVVLTVNEHENICIAGVNRRAGYAAEQSLFVLD